MYPAHSPQTFFHTDEGKIRPYRLKPKGLCLFTLTPSNDFGNSGFLSRFILIVEMFEDKLHKYLLIINKRKLLKNKNFSISSRFILKWFRLETREFVLHELLFQASITEKFHFLFTFYLHSYTW